MKVLYVEDDALAVAVARHALACAAPQVEIAVAGTPAEARACLGDGRAHDVVLADLGLPDGNGLDLVVEIRERALPLAVVVLSAIDEGETVVAALQAGADDFVVKREGYFARLPDALAAALHHFRAEEARRARPLRVLYAPEWRAPLLDRHRRRMRGEDVPTHFEFEGLRGDGTRVCLEINVVPVVENGRIVGSQAALRDITSRKLSERAMQLLSTDLARRGGGAFFGQVATRLAQLLDLERRRLPRARLGRPSRRRRPTKSAGPRGSCCACASTSRCAARGARAQAPPSRAPPRAGSSPGARW